MITVTYSSIDRFRKRRMFKTLGGARRFAQKWVGKTPELGSTYAVSGDGVGKVTVEGATLLNLFPRLEPYRTDEVMETDDDVSRAFHAATRTIDDDIPF